MFSFAIWCVFFCLGALAIWLKESRFVKHEIEFLHFCLYQENMVLTVCFHKQQAHFWSLKISLHQWILNVTPPVVLRHPHKCRHVHF